jgi:hypothetical protein
MVEEERKIAEILQRAAKRANVSAERADCPSEETLAIFLNGSLAGKQREQMEAHLARCSFCVEELIAAFRSAATTETDLVPPRLITRAMALVARQETILDLAVRFVKGSIEVVSTSGKIIPRLAPILRTAATTAQGNALQVEQEVGRFRVAIELDLSEAGICQVIANVRDETGKPAEGVRLSLSSEDREQASFMTRGGLVVFDRISPGEYSIAVSESGNAVGKIRLNLMLER